MNTIKKECQAVLLPTDNRNSNIVSSKFPKQDKSISFIKDKTNLFSGRGSGRYISYYLYILSDEEIKEGDWSIDITNKDLWKYESKIYYKDPRDNNCKKIIATTNPELKINVGEGLVTFIESLPKPTDEFIQEWIAKDCPEKINVEYDTKFEVIQEGSVGFPEDTISWWKPYLKISSDNTITCSFIEDGWNDIWENHPSDEYASIFDWLRENYNPPTKKN